MDPPPPPPPPPPPRHPASSNHPAFVFSSAQQRSDVGHGINFNNNIQNNEINSNSHSCYNWDYDTNRMDFDFQNFQPAFASPELINPSALHYRGGNLRSEYYSQFGSRIMNGNHVSRPADQENFPRHHGTHRSLQFGTGSSSYMGFMPTPMLTTSNNRSGFRGPSYDITNIGASSSSFVQSNNGTNYSINQMAANSLRMNGTSQERKVIRERNTDLVDLETSSIADAARETRSLPSPNHSESQALVVASPTPSHPIDGTEPISGPMQVSPAEQVIVPCNGNMSHLPDANLVEELNQGRPRSERPRSTSGKDGINRGCQCKNSQCLKLYCDCFAAGLPCLESCKCQNCENTSANAPKVQDARNKIETRNPLAFAPKVTNEGRGLPANTKEDGTVSNPSSLRHRTGCNCNKSKCVKKYCECYKGNAGCSFDCRCVNCENSFGRKPVITYTSAQNGVAASNTNMVSGRETQSNNHENVNADQFPSGEGLPDASHHTASLQPSPIPETFPCLENSHSNLGTHFQLPPVTILPNGNPSPDQHYGQN